MKNEFEIGTLNKITDVRGVSVGHATVDDGNVHSGVTVIIPSEENIFYNKLTAACYVLNGFGKTVGTIQIDELGSLESPIAFTNTLSVGAVLDALNMAHHSSPCSHCAFCKILLCVIKGGLNMTFVYTESAYVVYISIITFTNY